MFGDRMRIDPGEQVTRAEQIATRLRAEGVRGVVLGYVDTAGITRVKTVPVAQLARAARWGVGMSTVFDVFLSNDAMTSTAELGSPDGDLRLVPDLDRIVALAAQPGWAWAPVTCGRPASAGSSAGWWTVPARPAWISGWPSRWSGR
jgi:glutamine synthetase